MSKYTPKRTRGESGTVIYVTAISLLFLVPAVGLAVDGGVDFIVKARLGAALDSAALAAGRGLTSGTTQSAAAANATTAALNFFSSNFPSGYLNTSYVTQTACGGSGQSACANTPTGGYEACSSAVCATFNPNSAGSLLITVSASVAAPTYFMRWVGFNSITISGIGQATRPNLAIVLVLDKSSSMGSRTTSAGTMPTSLAANPQSCEAMVYNSWQFVQDFSPFDTVAEISFDSQVNLDYPPSNNFKVTSGSNTLEDAIANITCQENTNTTAALAMAASVLNYINQPQALNHIVLFTDGVANSFNSTSFTLRTSSTSPSSQNDWRMGPGPANNTNLTASTTPTASANTTNCGNSTPTMCIMSTCVTSGTATWAAASITQASGFATAGGTMYLEQPFSTNYPYTGTLGSGDAVPGVPAGCTSEYSSHTSAGMVQAAIAYIPSTDRFGNSASGPWGVDSFSSGTYTLNNPSGSGTWTNGGTGGIVEQVNTGTAPSSAPMSPNNSSSPPGTKNLGGPWGSYTSTGSNTAFPGQNPSNTFPSGPFSGHFRPDLPNTIGIVSLNTAYNMAQTIQANASAGTNPSGYSNPTSKFSVTIDAIYLQGNGGDPIAPYFLQYLTNQQNLQVPSCVYEATSYPYTPTYISNPNYVSGQPSGSYIAVSSSAQLAVAFEQIAASLLRITQ